MKSFSDKKASFIEVLLRVELPGESLWADGKVEVRQVEFLLDALKRIRFHFTFTNLVHYLTEQRLQQQHCTAHTACTRHTRTKLQWQLINYKCQYRVLI